MGIIYAILDKDSQPFYIGKTKNIQRRTSSHYYEAKKGNTLPKYRKIRKMLQQGFNIDIIILEQEINDDDLNAREQYWIQHYKQNGANLSNLTVGGEGGDTLSNHPNRFNSEWQAKFKRKKPYHHSETVKQQISASNRGQQRNQICRDNLKAAWKKRDRTVSEDTRKKMSESLRGKANIKEYMLTSPTGEKFFTSHGLTDFCRHHNLSAPNLIKVLNGQRSHHKGWGIERQ